MDIINDVLRGIRVQGRVLYRLEEGGIWTGSGKQLGLFQMHCAVGGRCWYRLHHASAWTTMNTGDILVQPRGGLIRISASASRAACPSAGDPPLRPGSQKHGPHALRTVALGGVVMFAERTTHPLISGLPDVSLVQHADLLTTGTRPHVGLLIDQVVADSRQTRSPILDRLFEILLIQVIRAHYAAAGPAASFMRALQDPIVRRAIVAIHAKPGYNWSLERLADVAGVARSTFSRQFSQLAGIPAMHYLTIWRMHKALAQLTAGNRDVERVARDAGYLSSTAFQKAFKRVHGFTPAQATTSRGSGLPSDVAMHTPEITALPARGWPVAGAQPVAGRR